ncbi:MAG: N-acetyl-gamma-glutamyl-phosphate reductase [Pseudomonadota bacterium]
MTDSKPTPAIVLGATGYVGGEFLRLIADHPHLELRAAISGSMVGQAIADAFPHLASVYPDMDFTDVDSALEALSGETVACFSALPHASAAKEISTLLGKGAGHRVTIHVVDASADFRFANVADYEAIYGEHGAPSLNDLFTRGVPELVVGADTQHAAQPGCFATAMQLAMAPLIKVPLSQPTFQAFGVTGATGAGKTPLTTTHAPERHSNLFAYKPLSHRHAPEVESLLEVHTGTRPNVHFLPHAGPFARGIHMSVTCEPVEPVHADRIRDAFEAAYDDEPFVRVIDGMPRIKNVVGSNYAEIGVAATDSQIAVTVVIDNLIKGAAGGAMQWMNRLLGWPETTGLTRTSLGWT